MKHLLKTIFLFAFAALFALPLGACSKSKENCVYDKRPLRHEKTWYSGRF